MSTNLDIILYLLIFTCLVFSALLSGSETAITSLPREKIHQLDESKKNKRIKRAKDQIENWFKNGISNKELEAKKTTINGLFNVSLDTTSGLVDKILTNAEKGRDISYLDKYQDKIKGLEKNKINDSIQYNIDTNLLSIIIAGSNI